MAQLSGTVNVTDLGGGYSEIDTAENSTSTVPKILRVMDFQEDSFQV